MKDKIALRIFSAKKIADITIASIIVRANIGTRKIIVEIILNVRYTGFVDLNVKNVAIREIIIKMSDTTV
jgi:hypothetical protein